MTSTATGDSVPATDVTTADPAGAGDGGRSRWMPRSEALGPRLAGAAVSGALVALAFPPYDLWPLAPLGVAGLVLLTRGVRPRRGALVGLVHGLAVFLPLLSWLTVIGPDAWVAVALLESSFLAATAALLPGTQRLRGWPLWAACLWVAQEAARDRLPFGGFPWGRLAFAETASPFTGFAALGGAPLVSAATALSGTLLAAAVLAVTGHPRPPRGRRAAAMSATAAVLVPVVGVLVLGVLVPTGAGDGRPVTVALVQGGVPGDGMDFLGEREQVLRNHVRATHRLADAVRAGRRPAPDLVVWPENASDIDPFTDASARNLIDAAVRDVGVPVLVGAVVDGPGPAHVSNTGIVWDPVSGPGARYVKRHPVPFGEYIPFRAQLSGWISRLDQIPRDFYAADRPGNLDVGPAAVGDVICFEVAYDSLVRDVVAGGADVLVVQTNNATYNGTGQPQQQMAMSRLRAVEHGRAVLVAATSGISAVVDADGTVVRRTAEREARTIVTTVQLHEGRTVASRLGAAPEWLLVAAGMGAALAGMLGARRTDRDPTTARREQP